MLLDGNPQIANFFDRDVMRGLVLDHIEGRQNRRLLIWSLLSLEQWCQTFLSGKRQQSAAA